MRVYGDYEAAIRQADAFFAALDPVPRFSTTGTSVLATLMPTCGDILNELKHLVESKAIPNCVDRL